MKSQSPISIVAVTDDHYMILLAALVKSIELNHKSGEPLHFYIVEDRVRKSSRTKFLNSFSGDHIVFRWIKIEDAVPEGTKLPLDRSTYPLNIYARLFIPFFVPKEVEKVIYLDVDMIVLTDISRLWTKDLDGSLAAAVQDKYIPTVSNEWGGIKNYRELGLPPTQKYFNSGLLVIDTKLWREQNIPQKVLACIEENKKFAGYPDQYGLNVVLAGKWKELVEKWNTFSNQQDNAPFLIHFFQRKPIYKTYAFNAEYQRWFFSYVNATKWQGAKPISESKRYWKKTNNLLAKLRKKLSFA